MDDISGPKGLYIKNLAAWRVYRFMSQQQLAAAIGKNASTIAGYERGRLRASFPVIGQLAEALGITRDELVYGAPPARHVQASEDEVRAAC